MGKRFGMRRILPNIESCRLSFNGVVWCVLSWCSKPPQSAAPGKRPCLANLSRTKLSGLHSLPLQSTVVCIWWKELGLHSHDVLTVEKSRNKRSVIIIKKGWK